MPTPTNVPRAPRKRKILFICTGNTCRSPMAEYILKDILKKANVSESFAVSSAGLSAVEGTFMAEYAREALRQIGVKSSRRPVKQLDAKAIKSADLILAMTEGHKLALKSEKAFTLSELVGGVDVVDPYGGEKCDYLKTANQLLGMITALYNQVIERRN